MPQCPSFTKAVYSITHAQDSLSTLVTHTPINMADYSTKPRSPHTQSFIPVVAPRLARSALPNSFSLTHIPPSTPARRPSISSPSVAEHPGSHIPQAPGVSSFRSLRNLLPFGNGGKQQASYSPSVNTPNGSKNPFSNFGSVRRSMNAERKSSATYSRNEEPADLSPVIAIEAPPTDIDTDRDTLPRDTTSSSGDISSASPSPTRSTDTCKSPQLI